MNASKMSLARRNFPSDLSVRWRGILIISIPVFCCCGCPGGPASLYPFRGLIHRPEVLTSYDHARNLPRSFGPRIPLFPVGFLRAVLD